MLCNEQLSKSSIMFVYLILGSKIKRCYKYEAKYKEHGADNRDVNPKLGEFILNRLSLRPIWKKIVFIMKLTLICIFFFK